MILKSEPYISDSELKEALLGALEGRQLNKVLLLPPDYTRLYSGAGKITAVYYEALKDICEVDIMPALGTHEPMTREEFTAFFGSGVPLSA